MPIDWTGLPDTAGPLAAGNIDPSTRPRVRNPDGSISTVRTIGVNVDGREYVIPTVSDDGRILSDQEAFALFRRSGRHFGAFSSPAEASAFAQQLSQEEARKLGAPSVDWSKLPDQWGGSERQPPGRPVQGWAATIGDVAGDVLMGAAKGVGNTLNGAGRLISGIPVVGDALTAAGNAAGGAFAQARGMNVAAPVTREQAAAWARHELQPTNTAQAIGHGLEQVAETFVPASAIARASKGVGLMGRAAIEGASNAGISAVQGGDPLTAGVVGAALPGVGAAVGKLAPALREGATAGVVKALGATKERYKAMSARLAPEILRRGIRGNRQQIQQQAAEAAEAAGEQIDRAIGRFGAREVGTQPIVDALESAKRAFQTIRTMSPDEAMRAGFVKEAGGRLTFQRGATIAADGTVKVPVVFEPRAVKQLSSLQTIIEDLGDTARVDQLIAVRRAWDKVVDQAGGFAHRAGGAIGVPLKDSSEAFAKREATSAIRQLLNAEVPELAVLNKEFAFWKSLDDVLGQTLKRTQPQGPGLAREVAGAAGAAAASGSGVGAAVGFAQLSKMAHRVFNSPRWQLASAHAKDQLAEAMASGNVHKVAMALGRVGATQGSKLSASPAR